ncbi:helix-turn-helix transcriptional regulator [Marinilabilia sp.]|uniref:helix-turn-helix transcriptional regulator n=1 Tax=Marinilabilia sp. TaxID=2021252 RepID=UPI0025BDC075|nr:helix-turn-helix transcriptional regulator [Marinilabilia sp.]
MSFVKHLIDSVGSASSAGDEPLEKPDPWKLLDIFSRLMNQSIYVADFSRGEFHYVSDHPLFLCGHSAQEVKEMGFSFYEKIIAPEDMPVVMDVNENGFRFFNTKHPEDYREHCYLSVDFRIRQEDGSLVLITQRLVPLELSDDNRIISTLCFVSPSQASGAGNAVIQNLMEPFQYEFNALTRRFILHEQNQLSGREKEVLSLCAKGDGNLAISNNLNIAESTVKQHKRNIFRKLGVRNTSEAVYYAISNRMV